MKTSVIHTRIDSNLKADAESILEKIGLTSSEAVRLFYRQIELNQGIPFDVKIPNKLTVETLAKSDRGEDIYSAKDADDLFDQLGMVMQANMHEAKSKLSQLAEMACAGEQVIIAKAGKPFVQLIPYKEPHPRKFGQFKGCFKINDDFDSDSTSKEIINLFEGAT